MRFAVFLALLVATFVACTGFANAKTVPDNEVRRLRAEAPVDIAAKFISTVQEKAIITRAQKMMAGAAGAAKLSDDQVAKLAGMVAKSSKQTPKSWPRLKKALKITLGVGVTSVILYAAYKMLFGNKATQVPTTTTTEGSA